MPADLVHVLTPGVERGPGGAVGDLERHRACLGAQAAAVDHLVIPAVHGRMQAHEHEAPHELPHPVLSLHGVASGCAPASHGVAREQHAHVVERHAYLGLVGDDVLHVQRPALHGLVLQRCKVTQVHLAHGLAGHDAHRHKLLPAVPGSRHLQVGDTREHLLHAPLQVPQLPDKVDPGVEGRVEMDGAAPQQALLNQVGGAHAVARHLAPPAQRLAQDDGHILAVQHVDAPEHVGAQAALAVGDDALLVELLAGELVDLVFGLAAEVLDLRQQA
mmetsp:Transcript_23347/g.59853  ORF Transcript_23347/g.59853 Transcript_23347/m.59853 type:complete len:274 (+) Transcript_23347:2978-3799(+)